jgi:hypothetical protein
MLEEVGRLCRGIPHEDLAIPWDVCIEMVAWDGRSASTPAFAGMEEVFSRNSATLGAAVPGDVELGFHLSYGDLDAHHFVEPVDATKMVELCNLIHRNVRRDITWTYLPVPIDRTDDAFYVPLRELELSSETELYLGLVHAQDGVEGTRRRMDVAKRHVDAFGIASECGISRGRDANLARRFIETYAGAAAD